MPERIQRSRAKGFVTPAAAVYVGRPSKWGNPFTIESALEYGGAATRNEARILCVEAFRDCLTRGEESAWWFAAGAPRFIAIAEDIDELRGHDLSCWCPLDQPCHADVLLELANQEAMA